MKLNISPQFSGYKIKIGNKAKKNLLKIDKNPRIAIVEALETLPKQAEKLHIKKLQGYSDLYRVRVGDYRIVFKPMSDQTILLIALIAHRKDIYKQLVNLI